MASAKQLVKAGKHDEALKQLSAILDDDPADPVAIKLARIAKSAVGEISDGAALAVRLAEVTQNPADWWSARRMLGKLRTTAEDWQPRVVGPPPSAHESGGVRFITHASRPFVHNGSSTRTHGSLHSLVRAGNDVSAATMPGFPATHAGAESPECSVVDDVTYHHLLPRGSKLLDMLTLDEYADLSTQVLAGLVARERTALLHVVPGGRVLDMALAANAVAGWAGLPWIYEVRGFAANADRGEYQHRRRAAETRLMRAADLVLTLTSAVRDEIIDRGIPPEKIRVVPTAVDTERFTPRPRSSELRAQLGLRDTATIGCVGGPDQRHAGYESVVKAVAMLRAQGRAVTGLFVGEFAQRAQLEKLATSLDVTQSVVFTGVIPYEQMAAHYAQMDVLAVALTNEPVDRLLSPIAPLEAIAMEVPVLVADLPQLVEFADDGRRARPFRAGDAESLAAEAQRLLGEPKDARALAEAGAWVRRNRTGRPLATALHDAHTEVVSEYTGRSRTDGAAC